MATDEECAHVARIAADAVAWLRQHETQRLARYTPLHALRQPVRMTEVQLMAAYRVARASGPPRRA